MSVRTEADTHGRRETGRLLIFRVFHQFVQGHFHFLFRPVERKNSGRLRLLIDPLDVDRDSVQRDVGHDRGSGNFLSALFVQAIHPFGEEIRISVGYSMSRE